MRVAFISRKTLFSSPGGDTTQMLQTAEALKRQDVSCSIFSSNEPIDYEQFDLLHFFNIIRPADILPHLKKTKKPFVVSTIYVEYRNHDHEANKGLSKLLLQPLTDDGREYVKAVGRWLLNGERINSLKYLAQGHRQAIRYVAQRAACLLPNSESEYRRFSAHYGLDVPYRVVPNGIDLAQTTQAYEPLPEYEGAVICLGRIEPRKNQLRLMEAMRATNLSLFIHGQPSPNAHSYYEACAAAADGQRQIRPWLAGEALSRVYSAAKVHVLPSFFETTGLVSLEAAAMGCNVVITDKGDTREYFGEDAWYCDPTDISSIRAAVLAAWEAPRQTALRDRIRQRFTWDQAALETRNAYVAALNRTR